MPGKIIKGIGGFYYVHVPGDGVYECRAKGIFRNQKRKPLVGDDVEITVISEKARTGSLVEIYKRKSELIRPAAANVDQAMVIFAAARPAPNLNLLDRFLVMMSKQKVETIVCFNKTDIVSSKEMEILESTYLKCGCRMVFSSALEQSGVGGIREILKDKTTVLAGPSGVGKSSIINLIQPKANMETGSISGKIERGKQTTRHSELFCVEGATYVMDTPGFSSLYTQQMEKEELKDYFAEFTDYHEKCRFQGCSHVREPDCAVKRAVDEEKISRMRYENYLLMFEELRSQKKY